MIEKTLKMVKNVKVIIRFGFTRLYQAVGQVGMCSCIELGLGATVRSGCSIPRAMYAELNGYIRRCALDQMKEQVSPAIQCNPKTMQLIPIAVSLVE